MRKYFVTLIFVVSAIHATPFSEQIIIIEPVTWNELQVIQDNSLKSTKELNLSYDCPTELAAFESLQVKSTYFKEILWTPYFWTEFENTDGLTCVIKHETFDFLANQEVLSLNQTPQFEVLNIQQASALLSAAESMGFDEMGVETLKRHVHFHNQAIQDKPFAKYGGLVRMTNFMMQNPQETPTMLSRDKQFTDLDKKIRTLRHFEAQYTKKTLTKLSEKVSEENKLKTSENIYPFNSFEELLNQTKKDTESKKKALNNQQSSFIYQIQELRGSDPF